MTRRASTVQARGRHPIRQMLILVARAPRRTGRSTDLGYRKRGHHAPGRRPRGPAVRPRGPAVRPRGPAVRAAAGIVVTTAAIMYATTERRTGMPQPWICRPLRIPRRPRAGTGAQHAPPATGPPMTASPRAVHPIGNRSAPRRPVCDHHAALLAVAGIHCPGHQRRYYEPELHVVAASSKCMRSRATREERAASCWPSTPTRVFMGGEPHNRRGIADEVTAVAAQIPQRRSGVLMPSRSRPRLITRAVWDASASRDARTGSSAVRTGQVS